MPDPLDLFELPLEAADKRPEAEPASEPESPEDLGLEYEPETPDATEGELPPEEDVLEPGDTYEDDEEEESQTRVADSVDRGAMDEINESLADTLPRRENEITRAKREDPEVARVDKFAQQLSRGTTQLLYEMGITSLVQGDRPLTAFKRSDLLQPVGKMLEQHVVEIEGALTNVGLTLATEDAVRLYAGQKIPNSQMSPEARSAREKRLRGLRTTM